MGYFGVDNLFGTADRFKAKIFLRTGFQRLVFAGLLRKILGLIITSSVARGVGAIAHKNSKISHNHKKNFLNAQKLAIKFDRLLKNA